MPGERYASNVHYCIVPSFLLYFVRLPLSALYMQSKNSMRVQLESLPVALSDPLLGSGDKNIRLDEGEMHGVTMKACTSMELQELHERLAVEGTLSGQRKRLAITFQTVGWKKGDDICSVDSNAENLNDSFASGSKDGDNLVENRGGLMLLSDCDSKKILKRANVYTRTPSIQKIRKKQGSFDMSALSCTAGGDENVDGSTVTDDGEPVALIGLRQYWACVDSKFKSEVSVGGAGVLVSESNTQELVVSVKKDSIFSIQEHPEMREENCCVAATLLGALPSCSPGCGKVGESTAFANGEVDDMDGSTDPAAVVGSTTSLRMAVYDPGSCLDHDSAFAVPVGDAAALVSERNGQELLVGVQGVTCSSELPMQCDMCTMIVRRRIANGKCGRLLCPTDRTWIFIGLDRTKGMGVRCLSVEFRGDMEIGLVAIRYNWRACQYLTVALRADKEFGLAAVTAHGCAVEFLSVELRGDMEIGLAAVRDTIYACQHLTLGLRAVKEFGLAAVTANGSIVQFLSAELRGDREIGLAAVREWPWAVEYLSDALKADKEIGLAAVRKCGCAVQHLSAELTADNEIGRAAMEEESSEGAIRYLSISLRADKDFGLAAVTLCGEDVRYLSVELQSDKEIGLAAVGQCSGAFCYLSAELMKDKEVAFLALADSACLIHQVSRRIRRCISDLEDYWDSDVSTVAHAELNPIIIQLHLRLEHRGDFAEVVCLDVAGSEVARSLLLDVKNVKQIYLFLALTFSVPPVRFKLVFPCGGCLPRIGATWDEFEGLDTAKVLMGIVTVSGLVERMAASPMDTQDESSSGSSECESF